MSVQIRSERHRRHRVLVHLQLTRQVGRLKVTCCSFRWVRQACDLRALRFRQKGGRVGSFGAADIACCCCSEREFAQIR